jgi:hypothetical protein
MTVDGDYVRVPIEEPEDRGTDNYGRREKSLKDQPDDDPSDDQSDSEEETDRGGNGNGGSGGPGRPGRPGKPSGKKFVGGGKDPIQLKKINITLISTTSINFHLLVGINTIYHHLGIVHQIAQSIKMCYPWHPKLEYQNSMAHNLCTITGEHW